MAGPDDHASRALGSENGGSSEDRLIARFFKPLASAPGALALTDDAAFVVPPAGCDLVLTTDMIVGGVHFLVDDPAELIARKAMRVNLSDLAAKGAKPFGFLVSLALPNETGEAWLAGFSAGLKADAEAYECPLYGGDTTRTPGPVAVSVTMAGTVPHGTMVKRVGAKAGDTVYVSGTIGDAALGLVVQQDRARALSQSVRDHLIGRYRLPQPRNALAEAVRTHASAAMDVSDGLAGDLAKLCRVSGVAARIKTERVPFSDAARELVASDAALLETAIAGGDDYEIVCTIPAAKVSSFESAAAAAGVPVTAIGEIASGTGLDVIGPDGAPLLLRRTSFSHF